MQEGIADEAADVLVIDASATGDLSARLSRDMLLHWPQKSRSPQARAVLLPPVRSAAFGPTASMAIDLAIDIVIVDAVTGRPDIQEIDSALRVFEAETGREDGVTGVVALLDAQGLLAGTTLPGASGRLIALGLDFHAFDHLPAKDLYAGQLQLIARAAGVATLAGPRSSLTGDLPPGFTGYLTRDPAEAAAIKSRFSTADQGRDGRVSSKTSAPPSE